MLNGDRLDPGRDSGPLNSLVPARGRERLDQRTNRVAARDERGAGHVPIADVSGGEDDALAVGIRRLDVFPAIDARIVDQITRFEMWQAHQVDHVPGVVGKGSAGDPASLAWVCIGAKHLAHIGRGAMQVAPGEDLQHQRGPPADEAVGHGDGQEAHQEGAGNVQPIDHQMALAYVLLESARARGRVERRAPRPSRPDLHVTGASLTRQANRHA